MSQTVGQREQGDGHQHRVQGEALGWQHRCDRFALCDMDQEIDAGRHESVPGPVEGHDTDQKEDHHPGHPSKDRDVVQQECRRAPEYRIAQAAELHCNPGSDADQGVHHCDREQVPADVLLDLGGDLHGRALSLKRGSTSTKPRSKRLPEARRKNRMIMVVKLRERVVECRNPKSHKRCSCST